jgi:hypothetical protein
MPHDQLFSNPWSTIVGCSSYRRCEKFAFSVIKKSCISCKHLRIQSSFKYVDISLRLRSAHLRSLALRWRKNRLAANYKCICGNKLTRGHIASCYDLTNSPIVRSMEPPFPTSPPVASYNAIDHALNVDDIHAFRELLLFVTHHDDFAKRLNSSSHAQHHWKPP